jgi:hypothetical protein
MLSGTLNLQFTLSVSASVLSGFSILASRESVDDCGHGI